MSREEVELLLESVFEQWTRFALKGEHHFAFEIQPFPLQLGGGAAHPTAAKRPISSLVVGQIADIWPVDSGYQRKVLPGSPKPYLLQAIANGPLLLSKEFRAKLFLPSERVSHGCNAFFVVVWFFGVFYRM